MSEPTTEAGRTLAETWELGNRTYAEFCAAILAIEDEVRQSGWYAALNRADWGCWRTHAVWHVGSGTDRALCGRHRPVGAELRPWTVETEQCRTCAHMLHARL